MGASGHHLSFDSDVFPILVDKCASTSITNLMSDFVVVPRTTTMSIQGISGDTAASLVSTVAWKVKDDGGRVHTLILPNMYYAPNAPY